MNAKLVFSVLLAGLLLFGCTQNQPTATATATLPLATVQSSASSAFTQEITMTATSWEFAPATIEVKKGKRVKLTITAQDVPHGFSLPEFGIQRELNPGKAEVIEFTPDKAGEFSFACSVPCGEGHDSMKGKLVVEEN